ncbi:GMC oxidoreductase [Hydnum rufescens UP504]|uniref:GMC oxidoreductase n=1 Tax=Hydnum rufescens UP504 TaxID=1448309 RepID=A0A9P6AXX5_9AGAM|nr:GMC oxidoreductase [Hydnum rufescens UP504]
MFATLVVGFSLGLGLQTLPFVNGAVITDPLLASNKTFDYIVVGGGLAGLTVAGRLSESASITVLVIEAGSDNRQDPRVYDIYRYGQAFQSELDWSYPTDQKKSIRAGKTLGGSSSINGAAWTRGLKQQYDSWIQLLDPADAGSGWDWNGMFSYMKKVSSPLLSPSFLTSSASLMNLAQAEAFSAPNSGQKAKGANSIAAYHGTVGPVQVTFPDLMYGGPQQPAFASAMVKLGLKKYKDLNGGTPNCVSFTPNSINPHDQDHRSSSATAYLSPVESTRTGWTTLVGQQVTKILFSPSTILPRVATGVQFGTASGQRYTAHARKEVILAAGSIGSPALLQLSGIGDATALSKLGIPSIIDLKTVGKNLQEQTLNSVGAGGTNFNFGGSGPSDVIAYPNIYELFGSNAATVVASIQNSLSSWASSQAGSALSAAALQTIYKVQANAIINDKAPVAEMFYNNGSPAKIGLLIWQLLPFSRGTVSIISSNPFTKPQTNVNYFSVDFDLTVQVGVARMARRVFQTAPLSTLSTGETIPGFKNVPDSAVHGSDADWRKWIRSHFFPEVSASWILKLLVYDTKNVRVVDASVMPLQVSAHLSSSLYGIAEKAADIIKSAQ